MVGSWLNFEPRLVAVELLLTVEDEGYFLSLFESDLKDFEVQLAKSDWSVKV